MTLIGWIVFGFVQLVFKKKIVESKSWGPCLYAILFDNWGGVTLGTSILIADRMGADWTLHTKCHECGHSFQNAIWGPFTIFLISIPSAIRYWARNIKKTELSICRPSARSSSTISTRIRKDSPTSKKKSPTYPTALSER